MLAAAAASWVRMRRSRCLIILLCSPILLPLFCATFPLLCIAELCIRFCQRKKEPLLGGQVVEGEEEGFRDSERLLEEGREVGLLQRYLEDQLLLVRSIYECGDEFNIGIEDKVEESQSFDIKSPLLG
uniref:Uncharacterized protein LOC105643990 n=1 Tax=Rhizophora mucronata TaxID=61149 RepID=A0A2P2NFF3_RHIMU